jgi:formamidopyrimidine-DNA glycosylase
MPELPEVETIVRLCRPRLEGRRIEAFVSRWCKNCVPSATVVRRAVVGRRIRAVSRRGKFIVLQLDDGGHLLIHLRMSGRLQFAGEAGACCLAMPASSAGSRTCATSPL